MRVTTKGQVTIPIEIREQLGIQPNTEVRFHIKKGYAILEKVQTGGDDSRPTRGEMIVKRMQEVARRVRKESRMTTDEIMALTRGE